MPTLPALILKHRHLSKLKNTYVDPLPQAMHPNTGRVHTTFNQTATTTGRLSSHQPNLQNIPIKTEEGQKIRAAFIAAEHHQLLAADYSQIELRLMAHFSQDRALCHAFEAGLDVHRHTASEVFSVSLDQVTPQQRRAAKAINFGLMYGMSAFGLAKQLGVSRHEATEYMAHYFEQYPGVQAYMQAVKATAKEMGYVQTIMGRRIHLPGMRSGNRMAQQAAERAAINGPLQGSAADLIKCAMLQLSDVALGHATLSLQVHDELIFEVPETQVASLRAHVEAIMPNVFKLKVPLVIDIGVGPHWQAAHGL